MSLAALVRQWFVDVEFRDIPPQHTVDTAPFVPDELADIRANGLRVSLLRLAHAAAIHYQGRWRRSTSLRWANAMLDLLPSIRGNPAGRSLRLVDNQSVELQGQSSEVLGVGLAICLAGRLFGVNRNRISPIEATGKRCDFDVLQAQRRLRLEAKGRQHRQHIWGAIQDVFDKKAATATITAYGCVAHVPRNGDPVSLTVVDPEREDPLVGREELVANLLRHYARASNLAGFWRLGQLLSEQVQHLVDGAHLDQLVRHPLDFGNVVKMGRVHTVRVGGRGFEFFAARAGDSGLRHELDNSTLVFGIAPEVYSILERQDFDRLIGYSWAGQSEADQRDEDGLLVDVSTDGTALVAVPTRELQ